MKTIQLLPNETLIDANDVARLLKVSRSWVYQRAQAGKLPCYRIGGLLRFAPSEILASVQRPDSAV